MHCGHVLGQKKHSVYVPGGIIYHVPAGPNGAMVDRKAFWIMLCEECNHKCDGDYHKIGVEVKIRGEGQWDARGPKRA